MNCLKCKKDEVSYILLDRKPFAYYICDSCYQTLGEKQSSYGNINRLEEDCKKKLKQNRPELFETLLCINKKRLSQQKYEQQLKYLEKQFQSQLNFDKEFIGVLNKITEENIKYEDVNKLVEIIRKNENLEQQSKKGKDEIEILDQLLQINSFDEEITQYQQNFIKEAKQSFGGLFNQNEWDEIKAIILNYNIQTTFRELRESNLIITNEYIGYQKEKVKNGLGFLHTNYNQNQSINNSSQINNKEQILFMGIFKMNQFFWGLKIKLVQGNYIQFQQGYFENNEIYGQGYMKGYINNQLQHIYEGNFKNGVRCGQGTYEWIDNQQSCKYEGEWLNDQFNGIGSFSYNQIMVKGTFTNGNPNKVEVFDKGKQIFEKKQPERFFTFQNSYNQRISTQQHNIQTFQNNNLIKQTITTPFTNQNSANYNLNTQTFQNPPQQFQRNTFQKQ